MSATRKIGIARLPKRAIVRAAHAENVPTAGHAIAVDRPAIAAARQEHDPVPRAASRRIEIAEVLPAEIATGRERAKWTLPPKRRMDRSDCGSDV